jgi:hypothetical protein
MERSAEDWCERGDSNPHGFTRQILSLCTVFNIDNVYFVLRALH